MTVKDFIHSVCFQRQISISRLAAEIEINDNTMRNTLNRNNGMGMTVSKLADWCERMGMQLVIEDLNGEDEYVIDGDFNDIPLK